MFTRNMLLAAFVAMHDVPIRKTNPDGDLEFEFDLEEDAPLVVQFKSPDGYNCNIHRLEKELEEIALAPYYVPQSEE